MPEPDEMERLRRADPLGGASLPSPTDPEARALFEEITMADTETKTSTPDVAAPRPPRRRPFVIAAGAVALVLALAGIALATRDDGTASRDDRVAARPTPTQAPITPGGGLSPGGGVVGSCVEQYDLTTLAKREVAFDGTVRSVAGDEVTFAVGSWFRGGSGPSVTMRGAQVLGGLNSAGPGASLAPGTRLLVAGDGGFAWSCGFTQPYDEAVARDWARVFGG